jgi:hypothetical protein
MLFILKGVMMSERLDLEQEILSVWGVKDDIRRLHWMLLDCPEQLSENDLSNMLMALENLMELRCQVLWDTFCKTYELDHYRKGKEND